MKLNTNWILSSQCDHGVDMALVETNQTNSFYVSVHAVLQAVIFSDSHMTISLVSTTGTLCFRKMLFMSKHSLFFLSQYSCSDGFMLSNSSRNVSAGLWQDLKCFLLFGSVFCEWHSQTEQIRLSMYMIILGDYRITLMMKICDDNIRLVKCSCMRSNVWVQTWSIALVMDAVSVMVLPSHSVTLSLLLFLFFISSLNDSTSWLYTLISQWYVSVGFYSVEHI